MRQAKILVDRDFSIGTTDPRLFGAFIEHLGRCTYAEAGDFFSYRRATHRAEPDYGRHISAIALVG